MDETRAALFDLDDTLFDHAFAARRALEGIHGDLPRFAGGPFDALEEEYARLLEEVHLRVLAGELTLEEARRDRMRTLLSSDGRVPETAEVEDLAVRFREGYQKNRRPAKGVEELLDRLRGLGVTVGIVTNNITAEQEEKLAFCGLDERVDFMVTSEEVGKPKPEGLIFEVALERAGCEAREAVVVGDSWESDVVGARRAGIRAVWYNPKRLPRPEGSRVEELNSFRPASEAIGKLLGT